MYFLIFKSGFFNFAIICVSDSFLSAMNKSPRLCSRNKPLLMSTPDLMPISPRGIRLWKKLEQILFLKCMKS